MPSFRTPVVSSDFSIKRSFIGLVNLGLLWKLFNMAGDLIRSPSKIKALPPGHLWMSAIYFYKRNIKYVCTES